MDNIEKIKKQEKEIKEGKKGILISIVGIIVIFFMYSWLISSKDELYDDMKETYSTYVEFLEKENECLYQNNVELTEILKNNSTNCNPN